MWRQLASACNWPLRSACQCARLSKEAEGPAANNRRRRNWLPVVPVKIHLHNWRTTRKRTSARVHWARRPARGQEAGRVDWLLAGRPATKGKLTAERAGELQLSFLRRHARLNLIIGHFGAGLLADGSGQSTEFCRIWKAHRGTQWACKRRASV